MAHNNFVPISFGAMATSDSINAPLEQLSDALDAVRETANAAYAKAEGSAGVFYGVSSSAAGSSSKQVTIENFDDLAAGQILTMKLSAGNTALGYVTLSINGGTSKEIKNMPAEVSTTAALYMMMVYTGSVWMVLSSVYISEV